MPSTIYSQLLYPFLGSSLGPLTDQGKGAPEHPNSETYTVHSRNSYPSLAPPSSL